MTTRLTKLSSTPIKQSFLFAVFIMISMVSNAQLRVDAGKDTTFCAGPYFSDKMFIGKNAKIKNAIEPYSVSWKCKVPLGLNSYLTASSILNDTKIISPYIVFGPTITDSIKFYLTVSDHEGKFATDSVVVHFSFYPLSNDYQVINLNKGDSVWLNGGFTEGKTDSIYWTPKEGLSNPDQTSTWCKPDTTTDYYFIKVDSFGCACPHLIYVVRVLPETNDNKPEFAPIGAKWYFNHPNSTSGDYVVFESKKDSIIQGKNSHVIDVRLNGASLVGQEYIYQNGDSIFYYNGNYNSFFLLYNFSAKAGDTITVHPAKFKPTKAFFSYEDSITDFKYKILLVDSVLLSGQWIKRQKVTLLKDGLWGFSKPDGKDYYIINKIGSLAYFFGVRSGITPEDNPPICRCYNDSDFEFKNPLWASECDLILDSLIVFPTDMLWKTMSGPSCGYNEYDCRSYYTKISGDTTINEMQYKMVLNSPDTMLSAWSVAGYIREAGQKVFYRHKYVETDCLLYDFGCSEGDTLNLNCWCTDSKTHFKVDSIRYLPVMGVNRKHIYLSYLYNSSKPTWIEGIGSTGGLLNSGGPASCYTGFHEGLLCCSKNGEKIYQHPKFKGCNIGSLISNSEYNNLNQLLSLYPNPANNKITISNPSNIKIKKIEMFDFSGRVVQQWEAPELAGNQLNIQHILPGIYLLKAETNAGIKTEKLVVQ